MSSLTSDHTPRNAPISRSEVVRERSDSLAQYLRARPRLWAIAYRTLGNVADADDIVQEAWLRWRRVDAARVDNPTAFLAVTVSRLALNVATAPRTRHETPVDPGILIPGPLRHDDDDDPESHVEHEHNLEHAIALLLGTLTPSEFAAYVLRVSFDYPYSHVAVVLGVRPDNARQLVSRAQRGVRLRSPRPVDPNTVRQHAQAFRLAARTGRLEVLECEIRARLEICSPSRGPQRHCAVNA